MSEIDKARQMSIDMELIDTILYGRFIGEDVKISIKELANYIRSNPLQDRIKQLEEKSKWQPIETAPKDGTRILINCGFYHTCFIAFFNYNKWESDDSNRNIKPTHWLPIPKYEEK